MILQLPSGTGASQRLTKYPLDFYCTILYLMVSSSNLKLQTKDIYIFNSKKIVVHLLKQKVLISKMEPGIILL
jgi:hypothetical protein